MAKAVLFLFNKSKRVLFLAIPIDIWRNFFQKQLIQKSLQRIGAKILVYHPVQNEIVQWIK